MLNASPKLHCTEKQAGLDVSQNYDPYCRPGSALHSDALVRSLLAGLVLVVAAAIVLGAASLLKPWLWFAIVGLLAMAWFTASRRASLGRSLFGTTTAARAECDDGAAIGCRSSRTVRWAWTAAACLLAAHVVIDGLLRFPKDYDCLMYHQPMIDEWLQAGRLYAPDSAYWWSPGTSELIGAWFAAPFSGDFLVPLNNVPFVVLLAAACVAVGKELGLRSAWAHLAAGGALAVHTLLHETDDASNDIAVAALFLAAVYFGLKLRRSEKRLDVLLCGAALGLLAGVKYFALGYAALAWAVAAGCGWQRAGIRRAAAAGAWLIVTATITGGYWYLRNWIISGTPVYPMGWSGQMPALGYPKVFTTSLLGNGDPQKWRLAVEALWKMSGPIHAAALTVLPAVILTALVGAWRRNGQRASADTTSNWTLVAFLLVGGAAVAIATPFAVEDQPGTLNHLRWAYTPVRYSLSFLCVSVLSLAMLLQQVPARFQWIAVALFAGGLAWQIVRRFHHAWGEFHFVDSLLLAANLLTAAVVAPLVRRVRQARYLFHPATVSAALLTAGAVGIYLLSERWHAGYNAHFDRFFRTTMFEELPRRFPEIDRICVLDLRPYPFFGSRRQMHVCRPRFVESFDAMIEYLIDHRISLVATHRRSGSTFDLYKDCPRWISSHPDLFTPVLHGGEHVVYRFNPEPRAANAEHAPDSIPRR